MGIKLKVSKRRTTLVKCRSAGVCPERLKTEIKSSKASFLSSHFITKRAKSSYDWKESLEIYQLTHSGNESAGSYFKNQQEVLQQHPL